MTRCVRAKRAPTFLYTLAVLGTCALTACAPTGQVILLPEVDGHATAVEVRTDRQFRVLNLPFQTASVDLAGALQTGQTSAREVAARFPQLLALRPSAAQSYVLHFVSGTSQLTPESEELLPKVLARANERPGGEITVIGHTDTRDTTAANDVLSLQRAHTVRKLLVARGFAPDRIEAVGRGEREPLVLTADGVDEPLNRRVEIIVR